LTDLASQPNLLSSNEKLKGKNRRRRWEIGALRSRTVMIIRAESPIFPFNLTDPVAQQRVWETPAQYPAENAPSAQNSSTNRACEDCPGICLETFWRVESCRFNVASLSLSCRSDARWMSLGTKTC
jgi:hypothetical protein